MLIERVVIQNFKGLKNVELQFAGNATTIVGDNETGKSTILEAINLVLTKQLNRRDAGYELHPFLFNQGAVSAFLDKIKSGESAEPVTILIEVYLADDDRFARNKGTNNSRGDNCPGVALKIELDDRFGAAYAEYIKDTDRLTMIPVELYHIDWRDFAGEALTLRSTPLRPVMIDPSALTSNYAANRYVVELARDFLSDAQQVDLALSYRQMREVFQSDDGVKAINEELAGKKGIVSDRELSVALDMTARASWESSVTPHLDQLPLSLVGKGEQTAIKVKLALEANEKCDVLLIEEPENHQSHANLAKLVKHLADRSADKQLIITTHSSFVLNKLGVDATMMFDGQNGVTLGDLPTNTRDYFVKLPGYDTLRMVLAQRSILVEGPSDELIVQKAYIQKHGKLPLEDGVEVISVSGLAFKRFLDIARLLSLDVCVVTDNDGKPDKVIEKYADYSGIERTAICFSDNDLLPTLEPHLVDVNGRDLLNQILGTDYGNDTALLTHMAANKAEVALKIFESDVEIHVPAYIADAVR